MMKKQSDLTEYIGETWTLERKAGKVYITHIGGHTELRAESRKANGEAMSHARYIGDGVYAQFDGYGIVITTGSHLESERDQCIVMEPKVIEGFQWYVADLKARLEAEPDAKPEQI